MCSSYDVVDLFVLVEIFVADRKDRMKSMLLLSLLLFVSVAIVFVIVVFIVVVFIVVFVVFVAIAFIVIVFVVAVFVVVVAVIDLVLHENVMIYSGFPLADIFGANGRELKVL